MRDVRDSKKTKFGDSITEVGFAESCLSIGERLGRWRQGGDAGMGMGVV